MAVVAAALPAQPFRLSAACRCSAARAGEESLTLLRAFGMATVNKSDRKSKLKGSHHQSVYLCGALLGAGK
jgi:hypothetical protein